MAIVHELTIEIRKERGRYFATFHLKGTAGKPEYFSGSTAIGAIRNGLDRAEFAAMNQKRTGRPLKGSRVAGLALR